MKKNIINEEILHKTLKEEIQKVIESNKNRELLNEMALPRKNYKKRLDELMPQVLENWCLVHYCTIIGQTQYKKHWSEELRGHLITVSRLSIKGNDSEDSRIKVLQEIWEENDFNNAKFLNLTVVNKFLNENLDVKGAEYGQTLEDCINSTQYIFNAILSRNQDVIIDYIKTI